MKKINKIINSTWLEFLVLSAIVAASFVVRLYKIGNPIADWHSWRQVDTASVTLNFKNTGVDLLHPRYHDLSAIQTGRFNPFGYRFVEFPIFNMYHFLGATFIGRMGFDAWGRLISILAASVSCIVMYLMGKTLLGKWEGLLASLFYALIPFNIYFTRVVLPDPLSTAFALISIWLFTIYLSEGKRWQLYFGGIYMSFALLVKPNAVFMALPILVYGLIKFRIKGVFYVRHLLTLSIVAIPILLWRAWMGKYLVGIPHFLWALNGDDIRFRPSFWRWIFSERLGVLILGVWGIVPFVFGLISSGKEKSYKYYSCIFLLGSFIYVSVFATASVRHDYYQIYIIPAVSLVLSQGVSFMWRQKDYSKLFTRGLLIFSLGVMFITSLIRVRDFYIVNHYEIVVAGEAADKLLPKEALVIAPYNGDTAFLYQTRRNGWPVVDEGIGDIIAKGADYYVSVNTGDKDSVEFKKVFKVVAETDNYLILDLHQYN
ncbi:MAG: hypothetical protein UV74_C0013G0300 [Candidatus Woesebacteria bacterium GW2011_GWB1_43_14]|uniref:Glycosyltransferase RgtA/B/C/D-like domain-containing protein n=1 Tax=Candidatus Woesebacteria bacterium GW2011_GWB1_43_14 TaxID=1618578 RepID=A0A0G1GE85_9BACT|nr:MAG: hypothetical protein UT21_C0001G0010 [Candidatus Woesebacteria bacterium GW2011_GWA1_39_11b]KKS78405.1 MAG: hypothetical protein UV51_C0001G0121 [Candidatus Woesebacteria bacterium GW2011_GWC1_42_9]KKS97178.1 MAG: hypothetical protein UV74_C0013G0300 [Candidatus Woesebacteria bacterium GW2011_GWB1_43_14]